jgi:hypothetical protein
MSNENNKPVNFEDQLKAERALFLGKTDKIPGSDLTVADARKNHQKIVAAHEQKRQERALRVRNDVIKENKDNTYTSMVVPGVNVEIKTATVLPAEIVEPKLPDLPADAELKKMSVAELTTLAGNRGVEVKANVDTEAAIIARLKGDYTDARFAPLGGRTREVLEAWGGELGLAANAEEFKEKYPNVETLSEAIEAARKKA